MNIFVNAAKQYTNITNYTIIFLLAYTGFQKGEAFGLTWRDIDFKEKTITVERTRDDLGTRPPMPNNSYRTIPEDNLVLHKLKTYQNLCIETKFKFIKCVHTHLKNSKIKLFLHSQK